MSENEKFELVDTNDAGNLATMFAKNITSKHNQHVMIMIVGAAGKGKSWAGLTLAIETSKEIARIIGGKPEDYFNMHDNLGTIGREEIKRVMTNPKKYSILFLDDVAISYNARKYQDNFNIFLNDLIQSFRPQHNLVIMTLQADFLIDKVPRSLAHYLIVMEQAYMDFGITTAKVFKNVMKHLKGKIYHEYLVENNVKYPRHIFTAPDKEITVAYEIERAAQLKKLNDAREEDQKNDMSISGNYPAMKRMNDAGITKTAIAEFFGVSKQYVGQIFKKNSESDL